MKEGSFLAVLLAVCALPCRAQEERVNLAPLATATTSYVSGDTSLEALNDGFGPESSRDRRHGSYGNWPRRGVQWVQYQWSKPIHTGEIAVYWWDDRRGVRLPKACRLLYWDGEKFRPVENPQGFGVQGDCYNRGTFKPVRTSKLRLEIISQDRFSTGILEWKVFDAGLSPVLPPRVEAGPDRVVVVGGRTFLSGNVRSMKPQETTVRWQKAQGPDNVVFADPTSASTTATFSQPGIYQVRLAAKAGTAIASDVLTVKVVPPFEQPPLSPVPTAAYSVDNPLWKDRIKALIVNWIPHCIEKIEDPELPQGGLNNFQEAAKKLAGKPHGKHRGYVFSNAWVFNTIEAMCYALMYDPQGDPDILEAQKLMRSTIEKWIPIVLSAQEPDGYLQTAFTLGGMEHWSPRHRGAHEGYVAGYFLEAAVAHFRLTGGKDRRLYSAAKKLADCWWRHIGPPPKQEWFDGHQGMERALVRFGRLVNEVEGETGGRRYMELAKFLLACRKNGHQYDQSHLPVIKQYEAVGHAVRATYQYAAMADVAVETGDLDFASAALSLFDNIVNKKYYVTGGVGSGETSEGFGPNYSLRQGAYCESCSSCGFIFFQHSVLRGLGDSRCADLLEDTLYNALLGSIDLAGKNFYYQNPLDQRRPRYPWHGCPCCVGNIPRTILQLPTWTYLTGPNSLYINLFFGGTTVIPDVAGTRVTVSQKTAYPWDGKVTITITPAQERAFAVKVRIPRRAVSELYTASPPAGGLRWLKLNGAVVSPKVEKGYAVLERTWKAGDRIELLLPLVIQRIRGIEKVAATRSQVCLRYGPLIYAFEDIDQSLDGVLDPTAKLSAEWRSDFLRGVVVIRGRWADGSPLLAIPYYARQNRFPTQGAQRRRVRSLVWVREK